MCNSLQPQGLQHTRLPCPSSTCRACWNSWWCHPTISFSVIPFSSSLQSFRASGSFPMSQFFAPGGQSIGASTSSSVLPMNIQNWFLLRLTGWISLQPKGFSRVFSNTTDQKHQFFGFWIHSWKPSILLKSYILNICKLKFRQLRGTRAIFKPNLTYSLYATLGYPASPPSITYSHNPETDSSQSVSWYYCHSFALPCHLLGNEN